MRFVVRPAGEVYGLPLHELPLIAALVFGGVPLVLDLLVKLFGVSSARICWQASPSSRRCLLGEYLAGALVVLMLSGGEALEAYAVRSASSVLRALAKRMPSVAHRKRDGASRRRAPRKSGASATRWWSSPTRSARSMAPWSKATASWTNRISPASLT